MKRTHPVILAVDDDPDDLLFIQRAFQAIGVAAIQTATGGNEAVAYLTGEGKFSDRTMYPYPDFLISDLKMPEGDGFAVLEHLKLYPEYAVLPAVLLSGSQDSDDIRKAYLLGARSYHVKPSSPAALRALVKALYEYWVTCEVPEVDPMGKQGATAHKLGKRFDGPNAPPR